MVEGITYFGIERNLKLAVSNGVAVEPVAISENDAHEKKLRGIIQHITEKFSASAVAEILFSCVLEMATNATKANMKFLFFRERGWDIRETEGYRDRLKEFKAQSRDRLWVSDYSRKAREIGLWVQILFTHLQTGLRVEVTNNLPLIPEDERRVREKLQLAQKYSSIMDFYQNHSDDSEGEGLGFAMSVIMLKQEKIDPELFRIGSDGKITTARVEIPFAAGFQSLRDVRTENK